MPSDDHDLTAGHAHEDGYGDAERALSDSTDETLAPGAQLTHAQRVERVNAYLKSMASKGIWSAIE